MTTIAQVSDLHFGSEDPATTETLIHELNVAELDLVILSGDLTLAARHDEFERAREFIDRLKAPTLAVPGNHDVTPWNIPERLLHPWRRWRHYIAEDLEPAWFGPDVAVVGLNTARRMRLKLDWSHGSLSRGQIRTLDERFVVAPDGAFRIIVAHHPFLEEEGADLATRPKAIVQRAKKALKVFVDERVDLVTAGHLHRTYAAAFETAPATSAVVAEAGEAAHRVTVIQAGTALSSRTRGEANAFNLIEIADGRMEVRAVTWSGVKWARNPDPLVVIERPSSATK
ncbi:metallophosphoesterase [Acuticoccus sediminis]|uniref:Metallophosphoesterase n=1 Tax=Acuticoccus sediminis TaxID=2184697 RepID=A0A8B2NV59_9HYPH|nr:metallophosphoesterase [Acuticoccus sediminis]RAI04058.1 metallophosphoesterase [Acuticoccus sediminis]